LQKKRAAILPLPSGEGQREGEAAVGISKQLNISTKQVQPLDHFHAVFRSAQLIPPVTSQICAARAKKNSARRSLARFILLEIDKNSLVGTALQQIC